MGILRINTNSGKYLLRKQCITPNDGPVNRYSIGKLFLSGIESTQGSGKVASSKNNSPLPEARRLSHS